MLLIPIEYISQRYMMQPVYQSSSRQSRRVDLVLDVACPKSIVQVQVQVRDAQAQAQVQTNVQA
jgi:hypothetical protein